MPYNHKQLTFAREFRGYSQSDLSEKIEGLSQSNLSKYEKGLKTLSEEMIIKIVEFLGFPKEWLELNVSNLPENAHYRKRSTLSKSQRDEIEYTNRLIGYIVDRLSESVDWPEFRLKQFDLEENYTPETVAKHTRKLLGMKPGDPVADIFSLLENFGIIIVEINSNEKFDGVSFYTDGGHPLIILNKKFSNDRKRRTLAHELGHLLMHCFAVPEHRTTKIKEMETERFASEFLMPSEFIRPALVGFRLWELAELKLYWLTSIASLVRRAKDLKCINDETYKNYYIELSRSGKLKDEGLDVYIDKPTLFLDAYGLHTEDLEYSDLELSQAFHIPADLIDRFFKPNKLRVA